MSGDTKNVFISHVHEDDPGLADLRDLLKRNGMQIRDASITSDKPNKAKDPDYIWSGILKPRIDWAGTLLVYVSSETKNSEWVEREIEQAAKCNKRIVGVWELGQKDCPIPDALDQYADAVVPWRSDRIIDAINGQFSGWEQPDHCKREPRRIERYSCA